MSDQDLTYIDNDAALRQLCARLADAPWLALDTEFLREKTYQPQLCLLQIAANDVIACVDPLALTNLDPLLDVIYDPQRMKVLHAARQDLEIFHQLRGTLPAPVFDTQLAATLLGHGDQIGYAGLVQRVLGVQLDKSHARTDWSRRPLDAEQLRYAADDVRYLAQIYPRIEADLATQGRLDWLREDFAALSDPAAYANPPQDAWLRVSGVQKLHGQQLAVLQRLAAWREQRAQALNRPRRWVLKDDVLTDLARHMPTDLKHLERLRSLEGGTVQRLGRELLAIVREARELPKSDWPALERHVRLTGAQDAIVDALQAVLRTCAERHQVSMASLGTRRDLERLVVGEADVTLLHGWRGALAGTELQSVLRGDRVLRVVAGQLEITPAAAGTM